MINPTAASWPASWPVIVVQQRGFNVVVAMMGHAALMVNGDLGDLEICKVISTTNNRGTVIFLFASPKLPIKLCNWSMPNHDPSGMFLLMTISCISIHASLETLEYPCNSWFSYIMLYSTTFGERWSGLTLPTWSCSKILWLSQPATVYGERCQHVTMQRRWRAPSFRTNGGSSKWGYS